MENEINYKSNPLHGVSLKTMLTEMVDHYGFDILYAYLYINCFKTNPSINSSVKFLKNTNWARESVESFYLYKFKNLPRASAEQFVLPPRDRVIPSTDTPRAPAVLSLDDAEQLREKREKKAAGFRPGQGKRPGPQRGRPTAKRDNEVVKKSGHEPLKVPNPSANTDADPWAKWKE